MVICVGWELEGFVSLLARTLKFRDEGRDEGYKLCRPATKTFAGIKMLRKKSINVMIGECYRKGEDIFYALKKGRTKINAALLFLELSFTMM